MWYQKWVSRVKPMALYRYILNSDSVTCVDL